MGVGVEFGVGRLRSFVWIFCPALVVRAIMALVIFIVAVAVIAILTAA